jgi:hypothetical protein
MVKQSKSLKKLAAKAERSAAQFEDLELSAEMRALATAYRSQAGIVRQKEKAARKNPKKAKPTKTPLKAAKATSLVKKKKKGRAA